MKSMQMCPPVLTQTEEPNIVAQIKDAVASSSKALVKGNGVNRPRTCRNVVATITPNNRIKMESSIFLIMFKTLLSTA